MSKKGRLSGVGMHSEATAWEIAEFTTASNDRRKKRGIKGIIRNRKSLFAYLGATHEFEFFIGDLKMPTETRFMTGIEASKINRDFEQEFYHGLDLNEHIRLKRWKPINRNPTKSRRERRQIANASRANRPLR